MNFLFIIGMAFIIEMVTYVFRLNLDLHSANVQKMLKLPVRVHHMYVGAIIAVVGVFLVPEPVVASSVLESVNSFFVPATITLLDVGMAIVLSDVMHHLAVLPMLHQEIGFP